MSKFAVLIFISFNLLVLLLISWGYIFFKIKKTMANEVLIAEKIQNIKEVITKHKKESANNPLGEVEFKIQQECLDNLKTINQQQLEAMAEIEEVEHNDNLDQESKERLIKAQLASLKAQSDAYDDTISILRKQVVQGNNRLSFIEEKLIKQKQELLKIQAMEDKLEIDRLKNIELNNENNKLKEQIDNQISSNESLDEMSETISQQKVKIENQSGEIEQLMQEYIRLEEESKTIKESDIEVIESDMSEIEFALERALTEKDFLESQFLDLLDNHDSQIKLKDELKRTKTEYMMLEEHFIDLADKK